MTKLNVDCLNLIFNKLHKNSLHSCLLVNKEWCNIVVPILWKKYSWDVLDRGLKKKIFNVILSCLPPSSRQLLSDNDIKLPSKILLKPPLFNYVSFRQFPDNKIIDEIVNMVFKKKLNNTENVNKNFLEQEIYKLFVAQCKNIKELSWETSQPLASFPGASACFSQLNCLHIDVELVLSYTLHEMAQICKDLNSLSICNCSQDLPGLISLINAQRNLKRVSIHILSNLYNDREGTCEELGKTLASKGNVISRLYLTSVNNIIPFSFLTSFINLKFLYIDNFENYTDDSEEIKYFKQYLEILEFPVLEYLRVNRLSCFKELAMIIEKSNRNILEVEIYPYDKNAKNAGMLIKAISENCPKIKKLNTYLKAKDLIYVKSLLLNCRQLECVDFDDLNDYAVFENDNIGDELLDILTKFSPNSLNEILINRGWKYSIDVFEKFFESCRERTLHNFGFVCNSEENYITKDHYLIIRKYVKEGVIKHSCK